MAKLDKETMKKQHFWLLLIPLFIGLLLAWLGLFFGVADATEQKAADNDKERKAIEAAQAKSKKTLQLYDERKEKLFGLRTERWKEMWSLQQAIYEWPPTLGEDQIAKVKGLKFGDEISDSSFIERLPRPGDGGVQEAGRGDRPDPVRRRLADGPADRPGLEAEPGVRGHLAGHRGLLGPARAAAGPGRREQGRRHLQAAE